MRDSDEPTVYEHLRARGYTRREFLQACAVIAGAMGLRSSPFALADGGGRPSALARTVARALQTTARQPIVWLGLQGCTGCTESLLRSGDPTIADLLLNKMSLDYHDTLSAAAGAQAEANRRKAIEDYASRFILVVEGSVPTGAFATTCTIGGRTALDVLGETANAARTVVAVGSCASFGGIPAAKPNPTAARGIGPTIAGKRVVNVPGCPAIPEVLAGTLLHLIVFGESPELDDLGRPITYYGMTIHDACERRSHFRRSEFARSFDDEGARAGWCLHELGCKGPATFNACPVMQWSGLSSPVQSGHPCLGCSEPRFWDAPVYSQQHKLYAPTASRHG
jgi:hydrogenase small subunit